MGSLEQKKCIPCSGDVPPLTTEQIKPLLAQLNGWIINPSGRLLKEYSFPDFATTLKRVNEIGAIAEAEGHHPDIYFTWGKLRVEIYTHAINGLSESDFVLAAKINKLS